MWLAIFYISLIVNKSYEKKTKANDELVLLAGIVSVVKA